MRFRVVTAVIAVFWALTSEAGIESIEGQKYFVLGERKFALEDGIYISERQAQEVLRMVKSDKMSGTFSVVSWTAWNNLDKVYAGSVKSEIYFELLKNKYNRWINNFIKAWDAKSKLEPKEEEDSYWNARETSTVITARRHTKWSRYPFFEATFLTTFGSTSFRGRYYNDYFCTTRILMTGENQDWEFTDLEQSPKSQTLSQSDYEYNSSKIVARINKDYWSSLLRDYLALHQKLDLSDEAVIQEFNNLIVGFIETFDTAASERLSSYDSEVYHAILSRLINVSDKFVVTAKGRSKLSVLGSRFGCNISLQSPAGGKSYF